MRFAPALFLLAALAWPAQAQPAAPSDAALRARLDSLIGERARLQRQIADLDGAIADVGQALSRRASERLAAQGVELRVARPGWLQSAPLAADSVIEVPQDMRLRADGYDEGFWRVHYRDTSGYLADVHVAPNPVADAVKASIASPPTAPAPDVRLAAPPEIAPSPTQRPGRTSSDRTAARCEGTTKKGARCKRKTTHPSGFCHQHRD